MAEVTVYKAAYDYGDRTYVDTTWNTKTPSQFTLTSGVKWLLLGTAQVGCTASGTRCGIQFCYGPNSGSVTVWPDSTHEDEQAASIYSRDTYHWWKTWTANGDDIFYQVRKAAGGGNELVDTVQVLGVDLDAVGASYYWEPAPVVIGTLTDAWQNGATQTISGATAGQVYLVLCNANIDAGQNTKTIDMRLNISGGTTSVSYEVRRKPTTAAAEILLPLIVPVTIGTTAATTFTLQLKNSAAGGSWDYVDSCKIFILSLDRFENYIGQTVTNGTLGSTTQTEIEHSFAPLTASTNVLCFSQIVVTPFAAVDYINWHAIENVTAPSHEIPSVDLRNLECSRHADDRLPTIMVGRDDSRDASADTYQLNVQHEVNNTVYSNGHLLLVSMELASAATYKAIPSTGSTTAAGTSSITATLERLVGISGSIAGTSAVAASLNKLAECAATVAGTSTVSAVVELAGAVKAIPSAGNATISGTTSVSAALSKIAAITGAIVGTSTIAAQLNAIKSISVTIIGTSTVSVVVEVAAATKVIPASGPATIAGTSTCSAIINRLAECAATIAGTSTVAAILNRIAVLSSTIAGTSTVAAILNRIAVLSSTIAGTSTVAAILGKVGGPTYKSVPAAGSATIAGTAAMVAVLGRILLLSATIAGASAIQSILGRIMLMSATASATSAVSAAVNKLAGMFGTIAGTSTCSVALNKLAELGTTLTGTSTCAAVLNRIATFSATIAGTAAITVTLTQPGAYLATDLIFTAPAQRQRTFTAPAQRQRTFTAPLERAR